MQTSLPISNNGSAVSSIRILLLKITLHVFYGDYKEWSVFKDFFFKLVYNIADIIDIEKLFHLKLILRCDFMKTMLSNVVK